MHRALTARWLNRTLKIGETSSSPGVLAILCPAVGGYQRPGSQRSLPTVASQRRLNHVKTTAAAQDASSSAPAEPPNPPTRKLPLTCSGCGAFTQTSDPQQFGHYDENSRRVKLWMRPQKRAPKLQEVEENTIVGEVLKSMDDATLKALGISTDNMISREELDGSAIPGTVDKPPVCDRCHDLLYYNMSRDTTNIPMHHPTVELLRETIEESPHKYNHIYHVIDAADFPMSLIPRLNVLLGDIPLRSRNRRSRLNRYQHDRQTEMSFIITRSDLLGPTKEMVDAMMPYLRDVLRDALGRLGDRVRLGSLKCVSAKRGWWTKDLKEDIWKRGGGGWMVGKVNVGKSQLFEAVFPKGRVGEAITGSNASISRLPHTAAGAESSSDGNTPSDDSEPVNLGSLLPPAQPATDYPVMPLVSSLPGTTASPIRIPFGNGKGELIDLPGLARSDLELFVKEEHRQSLIMTKRLVPEQISVKRGQSLLLGGGLIRITPRTPDLVFLMYNFTPIKEHLTTTEKAIGFQDQSRQSAGVDNISLPETGEKMKHAGTFTLRYDVTKERAGPLTRKNAIGLQVDRLPFRVLSLDILVEGVGYVEIVAQVRAKDLERLSAATTERRHTGSAQERPTPYDSFESKFRARRDSAEPGAPEEAQQEAQQEAQRAVLPSVDVYTPEGRFVDSRKPIQGWLKNKRRVLAIHKKTRPRKSMKGQKKMAKQERREAAA